MRAATSDTPQRAPAIIISVLCAVIYSEPLCGWLPAAFQPPPHHAGHIACLAGWLLVHVRDVIWLWGCLWKINKQRRHNVVCATAGTCAVATTRARPRPADSETAAAPTAAEAEAENTGRQRCRDVARCGFLQHVRS